MKFINQKTATLILVFLFSVSICFGQKEMKTQIDSILSAKYLPEEPGAVALISRQGKVIYHKAFGMANLELEDPMTTANVFKIGSMTKQFTAISIMMLMEQGKLNLSDEITKYIPDYPSHGQKITIHNLLNHTSGIKNYTSIKAIRNEIRNDLSPTELIDFFKHIPLDFNPGNEFKYNNSGYTILGHIIELTSGQSYGDFVETNIFQPLGMTSSLYGSHSKIIKNRASGHHFRNNEFMHSMYISLNIPFAAGSLMSTTADLLKWQQAIKNNTLISAETTELIFTNYKLNDGNNTNYGYGWHTKTINDVQTHEHGGSIFGFKSMAVYIPSEDIYVVILSNCDCNSPTKTTKDIAELVLKDFIKRP